MICFAISKAIFERILTGKTKIPMMKKLILLSVLVCWIVLSIGDVQGQDPNEYIKKYKSIAMQEMDRAGIPASIKLAQGILESGSGTSTLARKAKNHFGMKCGSVWSGKTYYIEDDDYDENGKLMKSCFRVFKNANASYIAHSEFLRDPRKAYRYGPLFDLNPQDYKAWAYGLKRAGYATSATYAEKLIRIIERYELYRFDYENIDAVAGGPSKVEEPVDLEDSGILAINNVKMLLANKGDTPLTVADRTGIKTKCILKYNDDLNSVTDNIDENTRVFLQDKRNGYRGRKKWHQVKEGESLFDVSQLYGISLKRLKKRNRIEENNEPKAGQLLKLRGWRVSKRKRPKTIKSADAPKIEEKDKDENSTDVEMEEEEVFLDDINEDVEETFDPFDEDLPQEKPVYHRVEKGETLYKLSRFYGASVSQIRQWNQLESNIINPGDMLRVK